MRFMGCSGSSPLTRGKRLAALWRVVAPGLIPAHAGKTTPQSTGWPDPRAHPRSRGENIDGRNLTARRLGSSPLTRGKLRRATRG